MKTKNLLFERQVLIIRVLNHFVSADSTTDTTVEFSSRYTYSIPVKIGKQRFPSVPGFSGGYNTVRASGSMRWSHSSFVSIDTS